MLIHTLYFMDFSQLLADSFKTCAVNEQYSNCVQSVCRPEKCSNLGGSLTCTGVSESDCTGGCVCKDNYFRAKNGTCITVSDCDSKYNESQIISVCF